MGSAGGSPAPVDDPPTGTALGPIAKGRRILLEVHDAKVTYRVDFKNTLKAATWTVRVDGLFVHMHE